MAKVIMYTTPWCGYCSAARTLLQSKNIEFEEIDVGRDSELRQKMTDKSNGTTVPQIFINGQPIGGYTDMAAMNEQGKLDELLAQDAPSQ
ncbi:MAG: glutaredoxin 3 [Gammaproteobacteria bacterium]|nr:glutaredoxin 3 [Gammaproteobacteria bacterium]MCP4090910.1 glutaredoxin 3 [Gammaproteobacteria bacterium]MCP4275197.1 glutaredoxin 3 [Gammaproteobacteria bacterium]MCP4830793.1 glutaredoxin 3 [Gammaproteobacteria bacterium]MCP4929582.1 glutaredoxin 3 [Gammaproteobacteria bacterium]